MKPDTKKAPNKRSDSKKSDAPKGNYQPKKKPKKFVTRDDFIVLKPLDEVKGLFRQYFSKYRTAGHIMSKQDVIKHVLSKLNAKEDATFADAINDLVKDSFIEVQEDGVTLVLTQKGADSFSKKK